MQTPPERLTVRMTAGSGAFPAVQTGCLFAGKLGKGRKSLRIVTPPAPQRTSLQEYRSPDPRSVVEGKAFDVEQDPGQIVYS